MFDNIKAHLGGPVDSSVQKNPDKSMEEEVSADVTSKGKHFILSTEDKNKANESKERHGI